MQPSLKRSAGNSTAPPRTAPSSSPRSGPSNPARMAAILGCFDADNAPLSTGTLQAAVSAKRSTFFALLSAMQEAGLLERVGHGRWRLGPAVRAWAFAPRQGRFAAQQPVVTAAPQGRTAGDTVLRPTPDWDPRLAERVDTAGFRRTGPFKLGFANAGLSNPWRSALVASVAQAARLHTSSLQELVSRHADDDPIRQRRQIAELVGLGIDALVISTVASDDPALSNVLHDVMSENIPVVAVDRRPQDQGAILTFVTASDAMIGRSTALWLAERLEGEGTVWMLTGLADTSPAMRRAAAASQIFNAFPGISLVATRDTSWTERGGYDATGALLRQHGPPTGIWCDSGLQGVGVLKAFKQAGLPIPPMTGGDLNEMYKLGIENRVPFVAADYPAAMGGRAVETALAILAGRPVTKRVEVPVPIILPRGMETASIKADAWAEMHVRWDLADDVVLSQGLNLQTGRDSQSLRGR